MKKLFLTILFLFFTITCFAQISITKDIDKQIYRTQLGEDNDEVSIDFTTSPKINLTKWNKENTISLKLPDGLINSNIPTLSGNKLEIKDSKIGFYFNPDGVDNLKFGLILYEKPATNTWSFQLEGWEEFNFWYQRPYANFDNNDASSWEYIDGEVHQRLPGMSGAWAVCHKTKKDHILGQTNFRIGTFGIFQRPKFVDADGNYVWGDIGIKNGIYTLTCSQAFLNIAKYPIKVNDTFGSTDISSTLNSSRLRGTRYSPASSGTVTTISTYCNNSSGTHQVAMYSDDAVNTTPQALLTVSPSSLNNTLGTWVEHDVADYSVVGSTPYWLCRWGAAAYNVYYLSTGGAGGDLTGLTFPTWPDPFPDAWSTATAYQYAIYATYTPSGGGVSQYLGSPVLNNTGLNNWTQE